MSDLPDTDEELKTRFNKETSKISWQELQRYYASGAVIAVAADMDLIEVACAFGRDNKSTVEAWLASGSVYRANDQQAQEWLQQQSMHWAVVVAPWVLVQEVGTTTEEQHK
jgi:hypothetical protein